MNIFKNLLTNFMICDTIIIADGISLQISRKDVSLDSFVGIIYMADYKRLQIVKK